MKLGDLTGVTQLLTCNWVSSWALLLPRQKGLRSDHFKFTEASGKSEELESGGPSKRPRSPGNPVLPSTSQTTPALASGLRFSDSARLRDPGGAGGRSSAVLAQLLLLASPPLGRVTEGQPWAWRPDDLIACSLRTWAQSLMQHSVSPQPPMRASALVASAMGREILPPPPDPCAPCRGWRGSLRSASPTCFSEGVSSLCPPRGVCVCACVHVCVCARACACVCARVCVCVCWEEVQQKL